MSGYVDLHCHWVWEIDDGARSESEGVEMLRGLADLGFSHVVATPHMRPGLFDNEKDEIERAFAAAKRRLPSLLPLPEVSLGAEHFFDSAVISSIEAGAGLPYGRSEGQEAQAVLIEFADLTPMHLIERMVSRLAKRGLLAVIAHPERYRSLWSDRAPLHRLLDLGCAALLDSCALVGKYGKAPKKTAIALLREGAYHGACSDAHRSTDIPLVREALAALSRLVGQEEAAFLLSTGPASLLSGRLPPDLLG